MMSDLRKDCPMRCENGNCTVVGGFCTAVNDPICEGLHNAYDAGYRAAMLRVRQDNENRPLTMDELRQMDGEPVWVSVSNNWKESGISEGWCIVRFHTNDDRVRVYIYDTRHGARFFAQQDYGISWNAYRNKPKE